MKTLIAAVALTSFVTTAAAKGTVDPSVPKEVQPMYCLVGDWSSQGGVAVMAGKQLALDIKLSCAPTPNKLGILCSSKITIEGMGTIENTDLFGYDPGSNRYHWFAVSGLGEAHDHVALPPGPKDKGITFTYVGTQKGKPMKEAIFFGMDESGNKLDFRNEGTVGGKAAWKLTATMIKK